MSILKTIADHKMVEVRLKQSLISSDDLKGFPLYNRETISLVNRLKTSSAGIIAEFKRRSPSKSVINNKARVSDVAKGYEKAGASGMSVLTDRTFFGGSLDDLIMARASCNLPILRKDFIISNYQIHEAKAYGADVILLIAAILSGEEIRTFTELAQALGLEVLLEVHDTEELKMTKGINVDLVGVNNRNLKTFEVSLETSKALRDEIPDTALPITESGIDSITSIKELMTCGYKGFLIGESFMKTNNPGSEAANFINTLNDED